MLKYEISKMLDCRKLRLLPRLKRVPLNAIALLMLLPLGLFAGLSEAETTGSAAELRQLAQLAEYIGVDYAEAVKDGQVNNDNEYREMVEFSLLLVEKSSLLSIADNSQALAVQAQALQKAIHNKARVERVRQLSASLRGTLLGLMPELTLPDRLLPEDTVQPLFETHCASCHGRSGLGDGALAAQLDPAPTDFSDKSRALNRSILGLYDAITNGIDDTAMPAFQQLREQQRWSLAFYVGGIAFRNSPPPTSKDSSITLQQLINHNPVQLVSGHTNVTQQVVEWLRANPVFLFHTTQNPLTITRARLRSAQNAHLMGDYTAANDLAVSAYLDGFELIENSLDARDKALRQAIEANMMTLRRLLKAPQPGGELDALIAETLKFLEEAERLLTGSTLSSGTLFIASLVILLREGLEALLVVIALTTVLIRTERRDALRYVHLGWLAALLAGGATWAAAQSLINISGASREVMEGVAALLAALVLLYVGIWMHSKTHAAQWQAYIQQRIGARLKSGTLWGLAALAFVAVYREVFETVLFYQSLLTQAGSMQYSFVAGGFIVGGLLLAVLAWVLIRYSVKLPIAKFFSATTYLLLALAFILMGKAVSALQEAAIIGIAPLPVSFEWDWIGVKSTWQGVLAQSSVLLVFLVFMALTRSQQRRSVSESQNSDANNPRDTVANSD